MTQPVPVPVPDTDTDTIVQPAFDLAAAAVGQQLAPPYAGDADGIVRSQIYPREAPAGTWIAWRADRAGALVAQLGSRATTVRRHAAIAVGYQFVQDLPRAGNYFWNAALRTVAVSKLPPERAYTYAFMRISSQPFTYTQPLVPGRTHLFSVGQYQHPAGKVTIHCGVIVSIEFAPGQSAYVEAIANLDSLVLQSPPLFTAAADAARSAEEAAPLSLDEIASATRILAVEGDDDVLGAFDGLD